MMEYLVNNFQSYAEAYIRVLIELYMLLNVALLYIGSGRLCAIKDPFMSLRQCTMRCGWSVTMQEQARRWTGS